MSWSIAFAFFPVVLVTGEATAGTVMKSSTPEGPVYRRLNEAERQEFWNRRVW